MGRKKKGARVYRIKHPTMNWQVTLTQSDGRKIREYFKKESDANKRAEELNQRILIEGVDGVLFGAEARAEYAACKRKLAGRDVSLLAVVDEWLNSHPKTIKKDFRDAIDEFCEAKRSANRREITISKYARCLKEFQLFSLLSSIDQIQPQHCRNYLLRPSLAPATMQNYRATLSSFCSYCRKRGWLETDPLKSIDRPTLDANNPVVLSPDEVARFMACCAKLSDGRIVRAVALRLFAGLRPGEQEVLTERDILKDGIRVGAGKIRGRRSVRIVPISSILKGWLDAFPDASLQPTNFRKLQEQAIEQAGLSKIWAKDILRHTWISYRLAETNDERLVAREAGNSPDIIYRHYFQLVSADDVERFGKYCLL
ncbi:MAG: phage integrase SAM-like domain-containing protein [Verrucomicrobiota bacterium]